MGHSRRNFVKKLAAGSVGLAAGSWAMTANAQSYKRILGANDRINVALVGINGRGNALMKAALASENTTIDHICDVDSRVREKAAQKINELSGKTPKAYIDFRKLIENKDVDAIAVATPEHWHAPMAIMGAQAGKHVYVEKPCSHNPREGEILIEVQKKTGKIIQMGNQQRSAPTSQQAVKDIKDGLIGEVYFGKAWYCNQRGPIGTGKKVDVPEWLNWELWQGPAPRRDFQDIWVHYNWHWFWHYGTGEINNNGTHEIDICRWAMGLGFPSKVTSSGGRFHYDDDWEFYDTQVANFEYPNGKMITWEGKSCNSFLYHERGRGATLHGTKGTILLDRNGYIAYNMKGEVIKEMKEKEKSATTNTVGAGALDTYHMTNFLNAIRKGEKQNSPINEGHITNALCHLGNISQKVGRSLNLDTNNGHILGDGQAMQLWSRTYEPGWEPKV